MYYHAIESLQVRLDTKGYRGVFRKAVFKKDLKKVRILLTKLGYTKVEQAQVLQVYRDYFSGKL